jgi:hypothetical protein
MYICVDFDGTIVDHVFPLIHPEGFERACIDWARVGPYVEALIKSYND